MKDKDFQQLVDHEFASLTWTDEQRRHALQQMHKEEQPVMKRKAMLALVLVISIMAMSAAALAVTLGAPTLQQLIDQSRDRWPEYYRYLLEPFTIDSAAVITPGSQRHTSRLVDIEVREAYMTNEALYLTVYVAPKGNDVVLWEDSAPPVHDGQELRYFNLYMQENIALLDFTGMSLHSAYTNDEYALKVDYTETYRVPDEAGVTYLLVYPLPKDKLLPLSDCTVLGKFHVLDCRSRDVEFNAILFDLPSMTIVESHDSFLVN